MKQGRFSEEALFLSEAEREQKLALEKQKIEDDTFDKHCLDVARRLASNRNSEDSQNQSLFNRI